MRLPRTLYSTLLLVGAIAAAIPVVAHAQASVHASSAAQLFNDKGCAHCHGADRMGTVRGPKVVDLRRKTSDLERQIREGGKSMPAFGDSLTPEEIHVLAKYVEHKRQWWLF